MTTDLTSEDRKKIEEGILQRYAEAAVTPEGIFQYPTGCAGLQTLNYDPKILLSLPETVLESFCGVGNPFALGRIEEGQDILDIGCGGGVDALVAGRVVGSKGHVVGIDLSPEMVERANRNLKEAGLQNVSFQRATAEDLPYRDRFFDIVISNGVFNLVPDKDRALGEVLRILRPGGRFMLADQVLTGHLPLDIETRIENWAG